MNDCLALLFALAVIGSITLGCGHARRRKPQVAFLKPRPWLAPALASAMNEFYRTTTSELRPMTSEQKCSPSYQDKPHVVTPEMAEQANKLVAEAGKLREDALSLGRQIEALEKVKERLWEQHKGRKWEAEKILLGPAQYMIWH